MKSILLIGLGRFGKHIAIHLNHLKHQVMAVDIVEERVDNVLPYVTNAQIGDSTNPDFMESLGVRNFDVCIVAIGNHFQNSLETTSLLKELGARLVVSRAARDVQAKFLLRNGADEIVYPEKQLAKWTAIRYTADHVLDYIELDEEHAMFEIPVPGNWAGRTIGQIDIRKKFNINIMGVKKNGKLELSVSPDIMLEAGAWTEQRFAEILPDIEAKRRKPPAVLTAPIQGKGGGHMREMVLLAALAAEFTFGYFLMKKLDYFISSNSDNPEP